MTSFDVALREGADLAPFALSGPEVQHLRWLLAGGLRDPSVADTLRRSWGPCPRHAWALGALDAQLHGEVVGETAAMCAVVLMRAARDIGRANVGRDRLTAERACATCSHVRGRTSDAAVAIACFPRFIVLLERASSALVTEGCPACLGADGPLCRPHLLRGALPGRRLAGQLEELGGRLTKLRSTLAAGHRMSRSEAATWVAGLGWQAGWGFTALCNHGADRERNGRVPDDVLER